MELIVQLYHRDGSEQPDVWNIVQRLYGSFVVEHGFFAVKSLCCSYDRGPTLGKRSMPFAKQWNVPNAPYAPQLEHADFG